MSCFMLGKCNRLMNIVAYAVGGLHFGLYILCLEFISLLFWDVIVGLEA